MSTSQIVLQCLGDLWLITSASVLITMGIEAYKEYKNK